MVSTAKYFVPDLLGQFCAQYPDADISLEVLNRDGVLERLMDNRDDLYIMSQPPDQLPLIRHEFLPNRLVLIAPRSHRLAGQPRLDVKMLGDERFIARERGSGTRMASDAWFASKGFHPVIRLELGSNEAVKRSVAAGMGLAVVSEHALSQHHPLEDVVALDVEGFRSSPVGGPFIHLANGYPPGVSLSGAHRCNGPALVQEQAVKVTDGLLLVSDMIWAICFVGADHDIFCIAGRCRDWGRAGRADGRRGNGEGGCPCQCVRGQTIVRPQIFACRRWRVEHYLR
ncbi:LysR substrate-binding domain-containing protein [Neopusillimonas aromaticivorans]|uniref:LysR substrate-binding domain-containing protein n=1 Tax=Neopusillimonas aromaticivorans TaxID=2979868 RepID=UPI0033148EC9